MKISIEMFSPNNIDKFIMSYDEDEELVCFEMFDRTLAVKWEDFYESFFMLMRATHKLKDSGI